MVETRQSTMQRIQVGAIGLVVVLLFVSLANMALERASDTPATADTPSTLPNAQLDQEGGNGAGEPLAELGVTPVASEEPAKAISEDPANVRAVQPTRRR